MKKKINVGVIFGGRSGEHEVSIVSAQSVINALDKKKYNVLPIGILKNGQWLLGNKAMQSLKEGISKNKIQSFLPADPSYGKMINISGKDIKNIKIDVFFPVLHGTYGEDGTIQGLLEMVDVPYVGAGVLGSAVGMDKVIQKQLFSTVPLPQVDFFWFLSADWMVNKNHIIKKVEDKFKYPIFIKPVNSGSSVGISKAHDRQELISGIEHAKKFDRKIIVEQGVNNIREIECAVLGNNNPKASVLGEIIASNEFYDYDAKYVDGKSRAVIPAKISGSETKKIQSMAIAAYKVLDIAGMARVDFFIDKVDSKIYINEINTIPGFTSISMYPKLWEATGIAYSELLDELIKLALERHNKKINLSTTIKLKNEWHRN